MDRFEYLARLKMLAGLDQISGKKQVGGSAENPRELVVISERFNMAGEISRLFFKLTTSTLDRVLPGSRWPAGRS